MSPRRALAGFTAALLAVAACGRGKRPAAPAPAAVAPPAPSPAPEKPPADTTPTAPRADSAATPADSGAKKPAKRPERPAQRCTLDFENTPETRAQSIRDPISQKYTTYVGGGVVGVCTGQSIRIFSDSAESYEQNRLHYLIGHVKYREDRVSLDADRLTYFQAEERLLAEGNVVVTMMKDSSVMTGPRVEYFRPVRGIRAASRIVAVARPTMTMYETDSLGRRQKDPVTLVADNIVGEGETLFVAQGKVLVDRTDLQATGDSAVLDNVKQYSRLMKQPHVESKGSQPFTLVGKVIDIFGRTKRVDRVLAVDSAKAVNKDLTLTAQTLDLRVADNKLNRAYAHGPGRAVAVTKERTVSAESLDVRLPNQRIRSLYAERKAYAESDPDTVKVKSNERDWMRGDTIVARFDSVQKDTTSQPHIVDLVAKGNASSYYQVPSNKGEKDRPGVNYVKGREILVDFKDKDVESVTVSEDATGVFLEAAPPDTLPPNAKAKKKPTRKAATPATTGPQRRRRQDDA